MKEMARGVARSATVGPMATVTGPMLALTVLPEGISWRLAHGFLEVTIDLANESSEPTDDAQLVIEVAPLGAFVPFKPGTRIAVAGFDPGERRRVTARIPVDVLGSLQEPDDSDRGLLRLSGWAGNVNVYFDTAPEQAVEVHRALDLEIQAGTRVWFAFLVGPVDDDSFDGYSISAEPSDPSWKTEAHERDCLGGVLIVTAPAEIASRAVVDVRVTRRSDDRTVPVRFSLETVAGQGETLGCIRV